ncbi:hypothetical protein GCM10011354_32740 [Egicoccus halophilus]|uniref:Uncharacterized protein n=1 Tax=Egicoccus halophilus TaxID=1670830 RepID=A0A8J3ACX1_9ACTN|nr:hypothetical protein GCM10011354_32740 [Egicoccus halophilus]
MGPYGNRALLRALLVGGAGSGLLVVSYLVEARMLSLVLNIAALILMTLGIVRFFAPGRPLSRTTGRARSGRWARWSEFPVGASPRPCRGADVDGRLCFTARPSQPSAEVTFHRISAVSGDGLARQFGGRWSSLGEGQRVDTAAKPMQSRTLTPRLIQNPRLADLCP